MTRVRRLDPNDDMAFGRSKKNFIENTPEVVGQRAKTRLRLWSGDWFLETTDGTPYRTAVLGRRTNATRDPAIRARILGTVGCTAIVTYASQIDRATRDYAIQATLDTAYGQVLVAAASGIPNGDVRKDR